jgi:hypothetical protein
MNRNQSLTQYKKRKIHRVFFCYITVHALQILNQEVLDCTAYSPDQSSDCHLFWPLKLTFRGLRFADDELQEAVHDWLHTQLKTFYPDTLKACRLMGKGY